MEVFTIGHSNYKEERLIEMLKKYNIDCVVDIRGIPYSKYNIQYNKEVIEKTLKRNGFIYIYMGEEFAAQRKNKELYFQEGYADFEKVLEIDESFKVGIERLKKGCLKGYRIALLGAKQDPLNCHRFILVGRGLTNSGFMVNHILDNLECKTQEELEESLIQKYYKGTFQIAFDKPFKEEVWKNDILKECYRKGNKEIGYRLEKI
ncbi:DUF488 domain-containing protein [Clostridium sp.]|uniref:DUF488 domain-containing protein n=1 Tax=Clostridium sp. TaxID=1506 RepID=UPI003F2DA9B9